MSMKDNRRDRYSRKSKREAKAIAGFFHTDPTNEVVVNWEEETDSALLPTAACSMCGDIVHIEDPDEENWMCDECVLEFMEDEIEMAAIRADFEREFGW